MDWFLYDNGLRLERVKSTFFMRSLLNIVTDLKLDSGVSRGKFWDTATMQRLDLFIQTILCDTFKDLSSRNRHT